MARSVFAWPRFLEEVPGDAVVHPAGFPTPFALAFAGVGTGGAAAVVRAATVLLTRLLRVGVAFFRSLLFLAFVVAFIGVFVRIVIRNGYLSLLVRLPFFSRRSLPLLTVIARVAASGRIVRTGV